MADTPQNGNNTGNNANNTPVVNYTGGRTPAENKGITQHFKSQMARERLNENAFNDEHGIMQTTLKSLEQISKKYDQLSKAEDKMSKAQKKRFDNERKAIYENIEAYKRAAESGELTLEQLQQLAKEAEKFVAGATKKMVSNAEEFGKLTSESSEDFKVEMSRVLTMAEKINGEMINASTTFKENLKEANANSQTLFEATTSTLKNLGNITGEMSKILNLETIAQNSLLGIVNERYNTYNKIALSLGASAKDAAYIYGNQNNVLEDFNNQVDNHFNMSEFRTWFNDMLDQGLTDQELLMDNLSQGVAAQKYLGLTADTQSAMLKYMKLTNNSDLMLQTNMQIVALTKAGIGVNREILNNSLKNGIEMAESLDGLGISAEAQKKLIEQSVVTGQAMTDAGVSQSSIQTMEQFAATIGNAATTDFGDLTKMLGGTSNVQDLQNMVHQGDLEGFYKTLAENLGNSYLVHGEASVNAALQDYFGNTDIVKAFKQLYNNMDSYESNLEKYYGELNNAGDRDKYIQDAIAGMSISDTDKALNAMSDNTDAIKNFLTTDLGTWLTNTSVLFSGSGHILESVANMVTIFGGFGKLSGLFKGGKAASTLGAAGGIGGALKSGVETLYLKGLYAKDAIGAGASTLAGGAKAFLSSGAAKALGGVGGALALGLDGYKGYQKSDEWGTSKFSSTIGAALGGTKTNESGWGGLSGAASGALKGAAIGTVFGPIGTAIGAGIGGILGGIGGKKISEGIDKLKTGVSDMFSKAGNWLKDKTAKIKDTLNEGVEETDNFIIANAKRVKNYFSNYTLTGKAASSAAGFIRAHTSGTGGAPITQHYGSLFGGPNTGGYPITQHYNLQTTAHGYQSGHQGTDFGVPIGTPISSVLGGVVRTSADTSGAVGNWVQVESPNGIIETFMHLSKRGVSVGQTIDPGDLIGYSGDTGNVTGPHLHYQTSYLPIESWNSPSHTFDAVKAGIIPNDLMWDGEGVVPDIPVPDIPSDGDSSTSGSTSRLGSAVAGLIAGTRAPTKPTGKRVSFATGGADYKPETDSNIINAINNVSKTMIEYFDAAKEEQQETKRILSAFSQSQSTSSI